MGYYKFLFAFMCFSLLVHGAFAQEPKQIEIINSNSLEYDENILKGAKRLIGNVQFKHENVLMFCDSAYYYDSNKIDSFGNVKIKQGDTLSLTGDLLNYDGNTKKAVIRNNIVMQDPTIKLTTQVLNYDLNTGIADYNGNGKIINKESTLTSKYGYYYSRKKNLYFRQDVKLVTKDYTIYCDTLKHNTSTEISYFEGPTNIVSKENTIYCQNGWYNNKTDKAQFNKHAILKSKTQNLAGDSIYYDRNAGYGKAICFVTLSDTVEKIIIKGNIAELFEKEDFAYVTDEALLIQYDDKDTLYLHSDTLVATYDSIYFSVKNKHRQYKTSPKPIGKNQKNKNRNVNELQPIEINYTYNFNKKDSIELDSLKENHRLIKAFHHVKFYRKDLQGSCDSLSLTTSDSLMKMFKAPILWSAENQLTAQNIKITFFEGKVYKLKLIVNAFIISRNDSLRFNQIKGKTLFGYFINNELEKILVVGNGQTNYWISDKNKALIGANHAECSNMLIRVKDNEVKKITFLNKPDAIMKPVKNLDPNSMILEGFEWLNSKRPKSSSSIMQ